ncbi:MAG TPA: hypothetical protein VFW20_01980 [Candidatus Limnocylindrales bacterium]|nr:hypothetical protein [Candidatus Limnocylindrales bacterium]
MTTTAGTSTDEETGTTSTGTPIPISTDDVRDAVGAVSRQVPEVARGSRTLMEDAMRGIEASSDERVAAGVTLSLGLAIGMLIGGAPRILTAIALLPVAAFGIVLMDRRSTTGRTRSSASS